MTGAFGRAVKAGKKAVVWAAAGASSNRRSEKAIGVLGRAVAANPSDEAQGQPPQLQNDKRIKMKAYEPMW